MIKPPTRLGRSNLQSFLTSYQQKPPKAENYLHMTVELLSERRNPALLDGTEKIKDKIIRNVIAPTSKFILAKEEESGLQVPSLTKADEKQLRVKPYASLNSSLKETYKKLLRKHDRQVRWSNESILGGSSL